MVLVPTLPLGIMFGGCNSGRFFISGERNRISSSFIDSELSVNLTLAMKHLEDLSFSSKSLSVVNVERKDPSKMSNNTCQCFP